MGMGDDPDTDQRDSLPFVVADANRLEVSGMKIPG
jgi:hypothetical protein